MKKILKTISLVFFLLVIIGCPADLPEPEDLVGKTSKDPIILKLEQTKSFVNPSIDSDYLRWFKITVTPGIKLRVNIYDTVKNSHLFAAETGLNYNCEFFDGDLMQLEASLKDDF